MRYSELEVKLSLPADKANHIALMGVPFGVLGAAVANHFGFDPKQGAVLGAAAIGVVKEVVDKWLGGDPSLTDFIATTSGGIAVALGIYVSS
jgi:hypothetical protein